jgi:hypothetical protein
MIQIMFQELLKTKLNLIMKIEMLMQEDLEVQIIDLEGRFFQLINTLEIIERTLKILVSIEIHN